MMIIIGAGMSGLLAANMFRKESPVIIEAQDRLPHNHKSLLRFRTNSVADASGILFKKVHVRKQINFHGEIHNTATIRMANEYCRKVTGGYANRSIWNLDPVDRFIAPDNFTELLEKDCDIEYGNKYDNDMHFKYAGKRPIISTAPMAVLMDLLCWDDKPAFDYKKIWSATLNILEPSLDVYQTTYYPNPDIDIYRISVTGNRVIVEFISEPKNKYNYKGNALDLEDYIVHFLENDFGISPSLNSLAEVSCQKYGKLIPIDDKIRKKFICWATNEHNIYSLGRWATHRQLLLDDVVSDISAIGNLIKSNNYNR